MSRLELAKNEVLPVIVQFLLQTVTPTTVGEVIKNLRHHISFTSLVVNPRNASKSQPNAQGKKAGGDDKESHIALFETLKSGIHFQKFVTEEWLSQISSQKDLVLFCFVLFLSL